MASLSFLSVCCSLLIRMCLQLWWEYFVVVVVYYSATHFIPSTFLHSCLSTHPSISKIIYLFSYHSIHFSSSLCFCLFRVLFSFVFYNFLFSWGGFLRLMIPLKVKPGVQFWACCSNESTQALSFLHIYGCYCGDCIMPNITDLFYDVMESPVLWNSGKGDTIIELIEYDWKVLSFMKRSPCPLSRGK